MIESDKKKRNKVDNLMRYFNDYFIRNRKLWKKSGKFEEKCGESILRAFTGCQMKNDLPS